MGFIAAVSRKPSWMIGNRIEEGTGRQADFDFLAHRSNPADCAR
jgi:hypothetical protein